VDEGKRAREDAGLKPGATPGRYLYESVSCSVGSDGTIYATGITNAGGMQQHPAWVSTVIGSPGGCYGSGYQSVSSGGYAVANASLLAEDSDLGEYKRPPAAGELDRLWVA
jgi:hypothetical protein